MTRQCTWMAVLMAVAVFGLRVPAAEAAEPVPVIHCTDLYHPPQDPDDHFDLATMYALHARRQVDLKAIILDLGHRQSRQPGSIPVRQMNRITGQNIPWAVGLSRNLARPDDKVLEDEPQSQAGVELILSVLRQSPRPVSIVSLGACRDVAAAFNREPDLLRRKLDKLMIFIGDADETQLNYWEYNVDLDRNAFVRIMTSSLPVYWVPCFDGGLFKNNGRASYWVAKHSDLLGQCRPELLHYFTYALEQKDPATVDPLTFINKDPANAEKERLLQGSRNLWCAAVFVHLAGHQIVRDADRWAAVPIGAATNAQPVFAFREVEVAVNDDATISYGPDKQRNKILRFQVLDRQNYAPAMTAITAELLAGIGR